MERKQIIVIVIIGFFMGLVGACSRSAGPLTQVTVQPAVISPNGDGVDDLARIRYTVNQTAHISIYLKDTNGQIYKLRDEATRPASPVAYEYLFNGISNGHLMPNGRYIWHVDANWQGGTQDFSGTLTIQDANLPFPKITEFTLSTDTISPNRDAIDDHVYINIGLSQKAKLNVYVVGANGFHYEVPRTEGLQQVTTNGQLSPGRYLYDYDGGINLGADPPPNGIYSVVAQSEDIIGQQDVLTHTLVITQSGRPVAEIVVQPNGEAVKWYGGGSGGLSHAPTDPRLITLPLGGTLYFTMAVRNTGIVPIRTAGPFTATECYDMDQNLYSKGYIQEPGAFRVGIDYETNPGADHPWRWGLGTLKDLDIVMHNGVKLYYLAPGKQVVVGGCIRFTHVPPRNPFNVYASLIQEDVEILPVNYHVSPVMVEIIKP